MLHRLKVSLAGSGVSLSHTLGLQHVQPWVILVSQKMPKNKVKNSWVDIPFWPSWKIGGPGW